MNNVFIIEMCIHYKECTHNNISPSYCLVIIFAEDSSLRDAMYGGSSWCLSDKYITSEIPFCVKYSL